MSLDASHGSALPLWSFRHCWVFLPLGGYVYRGTYFADLIAGAYVFGDNQNKNVYYIKKDGDAWTVGTIISDGSVAMAGFAEDNNVRAT